MLINKSIINFFLGYVIISILLIINPLNIIYMILYIYIYIFYLFTYKTFNFCNLINSTGSLLILL